MKTEQSLPIQFKPLRILTQQFATVEENYESEQKVQIRTTLEVAVDKEKRVIIITPLFAFESSKGLFLKVQVASYFEASPESWQKIPTDSEGKKIIPLGFLHHLAAIAIGTTRGVLHTKTEGTHLNGFILPTLNVTKLLTEDFHA
jgi:hypothetical protein